MNVIKNIQARAYLREEYLAEAAGKLPDLDAEASESTDESQRIQKQHRRDVRHTLAFAVGLLLFLLVVLPALGVRFSSYRSNVFWAAEADGKLYYPARLGLRVYDPQKGRSRLIVLGKVSGWISTSGDQVFYTNGKDTLYAYNTRTGKKSALTTLEAKPEIRWLQIFNHQFPETVPIILQCRRENAYSYYAVDPETGACTPYDAPQRWDLGDPYRYSVSAAGQEVSVSISFDHQTGHEYTDSLMEREQRISVSCWSFWEDKVVLGTGEGVLIRDLTSGENQLIPGIIAENGLRFNGEWLYVGQYGYGGRVYTYHCHFDGEKWESEYIGQVY